MKVAIPSLVAVLTIFSANLALAETGTFQIEGMTCGGCVKMIKSAVCDKMKADTTTNIESCDVKIGSMTITTKSGQTLDIKKVQDLVNGTGSYKVSKSELKK
jgi:copper chaperone CopZ